MAFTKRELIDALKDIPDDQLIYVGIRLDDSDVAVDITDVTQSLCDSYRDIVIQEIADEFGFGTVVVPVIWAEGSYR